MRLITLMLLLPIFAPTCPACTIFVLTDPKSALFCNNEDYFNPVTRLWFVPAGTNYFACAYVGFDNGWAQGGLNSEGLAFDWVAGGNFDYFLDTKLENVRGNSSQRMLETCATVEAAIAFYQTYREASFSRARILVADRTGASAIIGARNGVVYAERSNISRGFGYGNEPLQKALANNPAVTVADGLKILHACSQGGDGGTKYSNIFDLKKGEIYVFLPGAQHSIKLNFAEELAKGPHFYDIPDLARQKQLSPRPLLQNMRRLPLDAYKTVPDNAPEITARLRDMLERAGQAPLREQDFAPGFWKKVNAEQEALRAQLRSMGKLLSLTRVETDPGDSPRSHRYRIDFEYATVLVGYVLDENNRIASIVTDDIEQKSR
ncbi:MAG TPA: hypothetical protein VFZ59_01100 [Verrucomicrobiae bacterium]|nr:hypothetical protein [Verrucomicrobiae bacterium]